MIKNTQSRKPIHGFTLVELLVVISIIALMLSILMPSLHKAREKAHEIVCKNNLRQQGYIFMIYTNDNKERFPSHSDYWPKFVATHYTYSNPNPDTMLKQIEPYVSDPWIFYCQVSRRESRAINWENGPEWTDSTGWSGGWNAYVKGTPEFPDGTRYACLNYNVYVNYTHVMDPLGSRDYGKPDYYNGNKRVRKATDMKNDVAIAGDWLATFANSIAQAESVDWTSQKWNSSLDRQWLGGNTHSSVVGGINVLFGGFNVEKVRWSKVKPRLGVGPFFGTTQFFYW